MLYEDGRNAKDSEGNTPLIVAVKSHNNKVIRILVDNGCSIRNNINISNTININKRTKRIKIE